jgi:formylglycine-generating enzyme required for sulfatase activity
MGVHDLVGNGWEWTSTVFGPFPAFRPMASYPEYSADFFDGQHYVMKGPPRRREELEPAKLSQLVPAELSVRICHFPTVK